MLRNFPEGLFAEAQQTLGFIHLDLGMATAITSHRAIARYFTKNIQICLFV